MINYHKIKIILFIFIIILCSSTTSSENNKNLLLSKNSSINSLNKELFFKNILNESIIPISFNLKLSTLESVNLKLINNESIGNNLYVRYEALNFPKLFVDMTIASVNNSIEISYKIINKNIIRTPIISDLKSLNIKLPSNYSNLFYIRGSNSAEDDFRPIEKKLINHESVTLSSISGRSSYGVMPYFNLHNKTNGLIAAIGWSGQWISNFSKKNSDVNIQLGMQFFNSYLLPNEEIIPPKVLLLFYQGHLEDGQNEFRQLIQKIQDPRNSQSYLSYMTWWFMDSGNLVSINTEKRALDELVKFGLNNYWLDAGWFGDDGIEWGKNRGNWKPKPNAFLGNFDYLGQYAAEKNLKFTLWFEPELVFKNSDVYNNAPHGSLIKDPMNGPIYLLNFGNYKAREYIFNKVSDLILQYNISIYRHDFNIDPLNYWLSSDIQDRIGITEINYINGLYTYFDLLLNKFPNLIIDNCASGGRRLDYLMQKKAISLWRSDYAMTSQGNINHGLGIRYFVVNSGAATHSLTKYALRSSYDKNLVITSDLGKAPSDLNFNEYKSLQKYFTYDYYMLTKYEPIAKDWASYLLYDKLKREGVIFVFRQSLSDKNSDTIFLKSLQPELIYTITDIDTNLVIKMSGEKLMKDGILLNLPNKPDSAILKIHH